MPVADQVELKSLQRRAEESRAIIKTLKDQKRDVEDQLGRENEKLARFQREIDRLKKFNNTLIVSEHAILRYLERVQGINIEEIKKKILPVEVETKIRTIGNGSFPAETHRIKVQNGVVVTILTDDE